MKIKHIIAIIMTMVFIISLLGGSSAMATGAEAENEAADEELELLDTEKRTDLDETEIATAEDINVLVSSDYDVTDVKDGIHTLEDLKKIRDTLSAERKALDERRRAFYKERARFDNLKSMNRRLTELTPAEIAYKSGDTYFEKEHKEFCRFF